MSTRDLTRESAQHEPARSSRKIGPTTSGSGARVRGQDWAVTEPGDVAAVMQPLGVWWGGCRGLGGRDLWLGSQTRAHHDVEIVVRRDDQAAVHRRLRDNWELGCIDPLGSGWRVWRADDRIEPPAFQLNARARSREGPPMEFDIFLESTVDATWIFRREPRVQRPLDDVVTTSETGLPVVKPEVQLLYMSTSHASKNELDFERARPHLSDEASTWLRHALTATRPGHRWLDRLP